MSQLSNAVSHLIFRPLVPSLDPQLWKVSKSHLLGFQNDHFFRFHVLKYLIKSIKDLSDSLNKYVIL